MFRAITKLSLASLLVIATLAIESSIRVQAADSAPDYSTLPACTSGASGYTNKPCYQADQAPATDSGQAYLGECSQTVTNYCYSIKIDGVDAPATLKATVVIGAFKTHTASEANAGYEAYINLWRVPNGSQLNENYFGWGKRPTDQASNAGRLDLTGVLTTASQITMTIKYKTTSMPQYSVLVANKGNMDFALSGQDLTLTLTGNPSRTALEASSKTIDFDTEKSDDITRAWTDRCGIPSMNFVVCNVTRAEAEPLIFYARSKTFINSPAADVPGPIWVSTNATYFHQPSLIINSKGTKSIQVRTAAPHFLSDGTTINSATASTFLPNGLLAQWKIEKTEASLIKALTASITKGDTTTSVTAAFKISDIGVRVDYPEITYSAPIIEVGQSDTVTSTTAALPTTTLAPAVPSVTKSLQKGKTATLSSLIKLVGKGKATWKVSGGCFIKSGRLTAPKRVATCTLTLFQAKVGTTPARKVTTKIVVR